LSSHRWAVVALLLAIACQRQHPEDVPSVSSVGLVPAAPKALGARAATLEPLPSPAEPEATPDPSGEAEEAPQFEPGDPAVDGGVPL
jgi:hypothetical protein